MQKPAIEGLMILAIGLTLFTLGSIVHAEKAKVVTTASGLQFVDTVPGTGR